MSSLSQKLFDLLLHNEGDLNYYRPRHPLVVYCHLALVPLLLLASLIYALWIQVPTIGQLIYISVAVGLYVSSTAFHTWRPNRKLWFYDQAFIAWYILATAVPFVYRDFWASLLLVLLAVLILVVKWREGERVNMFIQSMTFLGLGAVSLSLVILVGLPAANLSFDSWLGLAIMFSVICFMAKLAIYNSQIIVIENLITPCELGHFVLAIGVISYTGVVFANPL